MLIIEDTLFFTDQKTYSLKIGVIGDRTQMLTEILKKKQTVSNIVNDKNSKTHLKKFYRTAT